MKLRHTRSNPEAGYMLLAVMLLLTLLLVALTLEAPRISQQIRRSKEEELVHRAEQYKMAIKRFVRKNGGRYPASIEQLENTNQIRFLRKRYKDPMTGKDEWRLLHVGEVQLNAANGQMNAAGQPGGLLGSSSGPNNTTTGNNSPFTGATGNTAGTGTGTQAVGPSTNVGPSSSGSFGVGNVQFGGAGIIGVASTSKQKSIKELNGKDHYNEWLFVYDPRLDTPRVGVPGGVAGGNVGGVGSGNGSGSGNGGGPGGPGGVPK